MKYTLLQIVQTILSSMDSDEINSINDTVESSQVVQIVKTVYGDIASKANTPENFTLFGLDPSGDSAKPTLMFLPSSVQNLIWLKYDSKKLDETDTDFRAVCFVPLQEFLRRMHGYKPSEDVTLTTFDHIVNGQTIQFIVQNDIAPTYYTTWDDFTFAFNSFDSAVDTTLQSSKTLAYGEKTLDWTESNTFVIPLDDHQLLLHEAKALAWAEMKQASHQKAERSARQAWVQMARQKHAIPGGYDYRTCTPNYGRK